MGDPHKEFSEHNPGSNTKLQHPVEHRLPEDLESAVKQSWEGDKLNHDVLGYMHPFMQLAESVPYIEVKDFPFKVWIPGFAELTGATKKIFQHASGNLLELELRVKGGRGSSFNKNKDKHNLDLGTQTLEQISEFLWGRTGIEWDLKATDKQGGAKAVRGIRDRRTPLALDINKMLQIDDILNSFLGEDILAKGSPPPGIANPIGYYVPLNSDPKDHIEALLKFFDVEVKKTRKGDELTLYTSKSWPHSNLILVKGKAHRIETSQTQLEVTLDGEYASLVYDPKNSQIAIANRIRSYGDYRPILHQMVADIISGDPKTNLKNYHRIDQGKKPLKGTTTIEVPSSDSDPLIFMQSIAKELSVDLDFKYDWYDSEQFANDGAFFGVPEMTRMTSHRKNLLQVFVSNMDEDRTAKKKIKKGKMTDFLNYLNGLYCNPGSRELTPLSSFDLSVHHTGNFGKFAPNIEYTFSLVSHTGIPDTYHLQECYELIIAQPAPGNFILQSFVQERMNLKTGKQIKSQGPFHGMEEKDYRHPLHRMLELYAGITKKTWHDPTLYRTENQMDANVKQAITTLFPGVEGQNLSKQIEETKAKLISRGQFASIPRLCLGPTQLPTPGKKDPPGEEAIQGAQLLVSYLTALEVMDPSEAERVVGQRLVNTIMKDFQRSPERAEEIIGSLSGPMAEVKYGS